MPKAGKKNHIFGDFFSEATKKNAKTGKEFGIEGKKMSFFPFLDYSQLFALKSVRIANSAECSNGKQKYHKQLFFVSIHSIQNSLKIPPETAKELNFRFF